MCSSDLPEDRHLTLQMHELLTYLGQQDVITLMILGQHGLVGDIRSDIDLSYLADTVLLMRFFEANGEVRKAISVEIGWLPRGNTQSAVSPSSATSTEATPGNFCNSAAIAAAPPDAKSRRMALW